MKESAKAQKSMDAMAKQREKETQIVKRAMVELKTLKGQVSSKDKEVHYTPVACDLACWLLTQGRVLRLCC